VLRQARLYLLIIFVNVSANVEEFDFETLLAGSNDTQPITQLRALQITLCQVFEVTLGERDGSCDPDFTFTCYMRNIDCQLFFFHHSLRMSLLTFLLNFNNFAQLTGFVVNLDAFLQVLAEAGSVQDSIVSWSAKVDEEFVASWLLVSFGDSHCED
jgi:hypothetical protein